MPTFLLQEWLEPQKTLQTPKAHSCCDRPPSSTPSPNPRAGLTSPHQNVRWQNRKAAVCSRHLKVHLHTLPAQSVSPLLSLPRQWKWATETCAWISTCVGFNYVFFFFSFYVYIYFLDCVCLVAIFKHFLYRTRHNISL